MTVYLYPERLTKAAYKRDIAAGVKFTAKKLTPAGDISLKEGTHAFSTPHYPKPHMAYGQATIVDGVVVKVV